MLRIIATRDGVCPADDFEAHERAFTNSSGSGLWGQLRQALAEIETSGYLPYSGVWVVKSGDVPLAVIAGHWPSPAMVHPEERLTADRLRWDRDRSLLLHFHLHRDHSAPPGPAAVMADRRLAVQRLAAARAAEGVD